MCHPFAGFTGLLAKNLYSRFCLLLGRHLSRHPQQELVPCPNDQDGSPLGPNASRKPKPLRSTGRRSCTDAARQSRLVCADGSRVGSQARWCAATAKPRLNYIQKPGQTNNCCRCEPVCHNAYGCSETKDRRLTTRRRYHGYKPVLVEQFTAMGFDLDNVVATLEFFRIDKFHENLPPSRMSDVTTRLLGEQP